MQNLHTTAMDGGSVENVGTIFNHYIRVDNRFFLEKATPSYLHPLSAEEPYLLIILILYQCQNPPGIIIGFPVAILIKHQ